MNAFDMLGDDHEKVAGLLERLDETTERAIKTRETLFAKLKDDVTLHSRIEETLFYPVLENREETRVITLKAYETHGVIKNLLNELSALSVDTPEWTAKLKLVKDTVEQHVQDEEGEMFKGARQVLTKKEIDTLSEQIAEARRHPDEMAPETRASRVSAIAGGPSQAVRSAAQATTSFCSSCQAAATNFFRSVCGSPQGGRTYRSY